MSSDANSRLMWWMMMPMTKIADEEVEQHADLDEERHRLDERAGRR